MRNEKQKLRVGSVGRLLLSVSIGLTLTGDSNANESVIHQPVKPQTITDWRVTPSFKFDMLCFVGVLTGDPFYLKYYKEEYSEFAPRLTPAARKALKNLKRKLKDENNNIISAFLSLHFSATDDVTIDEMLMTLEDSRVMKRNLKQTVYYNETSWQLYESVRGDLKRVLVCLRDAGFLAYWNRNVLPKVQQRSLSFERDLPNYDLVPVIESHLGFSLGSNTITIYLLYFAQPHGIRVTGTRFIADISYPFKVVLQNAIHEMMHPPYLLAGDQELIQALEKLKTDAFLMDKVLNHNPSFGYNSFSSYIEEDCVRALEQLVTEKLNIAREAHIRWQEEDGGIHVFAAPLHSLMKQENFNQRPESFRDFLIRMFKSRKLSPGNIKHLYDAFYSTKAVE